MGNRQTFDNHRSKLFSENLPVRIERGGIGNILAVDIISPNGSKSRIRNARLFSGQGNFINFNYDFDQNGRYIIQINAGFITNSPFLVRLTIGNQIIDQKRVYGQQIADFFYNHGKKDTGGISLSATPRYKVVSPVSNGYYTESVRELNERQIADMKSRGFQVEQVSSSFALQNAVSIPATRRSIGVHSTPSISRRARRGFTDHKYYNRSVRQIESSVIPKSSFNPRNIFAENLFSEDKYSFKVQQINPQTKRVVNTLTFTRVPQATYNFWVRQDGVRVYGLTIRRSSVRSPGYSNRPTSIANFVDYQSQQKDQSNNAEIQRLNQELRNQKAWIESINQRTSEQLEALGESTSQRSQENIETRQQLEEQKKIFEKLNARVSQQLIDLGNAVTDIQKSIEITKAKKTVDQVQKSANGILGGIQSFFSTPSNYILIIIVVMMMVMMKR